MITFFNKGEVIKGSDCNLFVWLFPCFVNKETVFSLTCNFYTASGCSIEKFQEDFTFSGNGGAVHFQYQELEQLEDGVIRYTVRYGYSFEDTVIDEQTLESSTTIVESSLTLDLSSNYYLKTPVDYEPINFVTQEDLESAVESAITGSTVRLRMRANSVSSTTASDIVMAHDYLKRGLVKYIETSFNNETNRGSIDYYTNDRDLYIFSTYIPVGSNTITKWLVALDKNQDGTYAYTILKKETLYGNVFVFDTELAALEERVARLERIINHE